MFRPDYGFIEVIVGPMFSGKSEELIRKAKRALIAGKNILVFKPKIDNRYSDENVASHNGNFLKGMAISSVEEIRNEIKKAKNLFLVAIDEVQFLDEEIINFAEELADSGVQVILSGLDQDFKGDPFKITASLMARAEFVTKLQAVCVKCGRPATKSQRIINGKPANITDEIIVVGEKESYEARCRRCHEVINKNEKK